MGTVETEVCVLGGGPAGAAIASRLARLGHGVILIAGGASRRSPRVESVSPGRRHFLAQLELEGALETCAVECEEPVVRWGSPDPIVPAARGPSGSLLDRARFDVAVLEAARQAGARIVPLPGGAIPSRYAGGGWRIRPSADGGTSGVHARFLIAATGRRAALTGRRKRLLPPLLCLQARWQPSERQRPRFVVEALREGWVWGAPLPDGSYCAAVFVDPRGSAGVGRQRIETRYLALVSEATVLGPCVRGERVSSVTACDASATLAGETIGADWMRVGDAAVALEPLSGQGLQVALKLGCQGAAVVHTMLSDARSAPTARSFYMRQCREIAARHVNAAAHCCAEVERFGNAPFWMTRVCPPGNALPRTASVPPVGAGTPLRLSPDAGIIRFPSLVGDRICLQPALDHPSLDGPVTHLGEVAVASLLFESTETRTAGEWCRLWARIGSEAWAFQLLDWLLRRGILIPMRVF